jgi:hypothetical protein
MTLPTVASLPPEMITPLIVDVGARRGHRRATCQDHRGTRQRTRSRIFRVAQRWREGLPARGRLTSSSSPIHRSNGPLGRKVGSAFYGGGGMSSGIASGPLQPGVVDLFAIVGKVADEGLHLGHEMGSLDTAAASMVCLPGRGRTGWPSRRRRRVQ